MLLVPGWDTPSLQDPDFDGNYTESCLQRVWLLQAPGYNQQNFFQKRRLLFDINGFKSSDIKSIACNEHISMNQVTRCKREPVHVT